MKTFGKVFGIILVCLVVLVGVLRVTGLEPKDRRPGLWLKGDLVTEPVTDWSFVSKYATDRVQTRTWYFIPQSVLQALAERNHQQTSSNGSTMHLFHVLPE
jgi:hypothetical protein